MYSVLYVIKSSDVIACAVAFSQQTFSVDEDGGPARVDVVACNMLPDDFDIVINTRDGSASGMVVSNQWIALHSYYVVNNVEELLFD